MTRKKHLGFNEAAKTAHVEFLRKNISLVDNKQIKRPYLISITSTGLNYILFSP